MAASDRVEIPGSQRPLDPDHRRVGEIDPTAEIEVTVYLRPRASADGWTPKLYARRPSAGG